MTTPNDVKSIIIGTKPIRWKELQFLQTEGLKDLSPEDRQRLRKSILENEFADPFKVWEYKGILYSLDGKHRVLILEELEQEGYKIPEMLPGTFIRCKNKKVAAALVLVYSSIYARTNQEGLYDYLQEHGLDIDSIRQYLSLPEIDLDKLCIPDFSDSNMEINVEQFPDQMEMKFQFSKDDFVMINIKLEAVRRDLQLPSKDEALKHLATTYV